MGDALSTRAITVTMEFTSENMGEPARKSRWGNQPQHLSLMLWSLYYNQCDELCRPLARWRGCVWHREGLTRQRAGAVQHSLNARQRRQNLKNAFQLEFAVQGLHIALVDDVVTTGSTVAEISRLLLRNGAATVQVWCLCRTL